MYGIFVNENGHIHYAMLIALGYKPIETRNRNMLQALVGKRVAIVRTHRNHSPVVVGYADITGSEFCPASKFEDYRAETCIPQGSMYDCHGKGKWFYHMANAERCDPYPLPADAVRHGRSWCEF